MPAFARLHAANEHDSVQRLFDRSLRWLLLINVPAGLVLIFLARPLLTFWAGPVFAEHGAVALAVLAVGCVTNGLAYVPIMLLQGVGRIDLMVRYFLWLVVPYIALTALLTHMWGPAGAALAWTIRACAECGLMLYASHKAVGVAPSQMRAAVPVLVPAIIMSVVLALTPAWLTASIPGLALTMAASGGCYVLVTWLTVLTGEERVWLLHRGAMLKARITAQQIA